MSDRPVFILSCAADHGSARDEPAGYQTNARREDRDSGDQLTDGSAVVFGLSAEWVAITIFAFTYLLIIAERITKYGVGVMLISVAISNLYLWFRYVQ
jgi:hypothetical protein